MTTSKKPQLQNSSVPNRKGSDLYFTICTRLKTMKAKDVAHSLGMQPSALSYHLNKLKLLDVIQRKGYGTWEVKEQHLNRIHTMGRRPKKKLRQVQKTKSCRSSPTGGLENFEVVARPRKDQVGSHGFLWVLKLPKLARWNQTGRRKYLSARGIDHTPIHQGERLESDLTLGWKIHLTNKSIVGYAPRGQRWFADSAREGAAASMFEFLSIVQRIERAMGVGLRINGIYQVKPRREHHALVGNALPLITKERREKFAIWDDQGVWLLIDESGEEGPELETVAQGKRAGPEIRNATEIVRQDYNMLKDEGITRQFLLDQISRVASLQESYAKNIEEHVGMVKEMRKLLKEVNEKKK